MADFTDRITLVVRTVADKTGLTSIKTAVSEADGVFAKFKAGGSAALTAVGANAGLLGTVAAGAIIDFAIHSVDAFDKINLAARNLSAATGLTLEQSSRWIGAAKDMGLNADNLFFGLSRVAKTIDDTKWQAYGIDTHDAAGKILPINDILLAVADKMSTITDEQTKAAIGNDLFGRGYTKISPMIEQGRAALEGYLATVEKSQLVNGGTLAQAEANVRAQANLKQAVNGLALSFGGLLTSAAPVLNLLANITRVAAGLTSSVLGMFTGVQTATDGFQKFFESTGKFDLSSSIKQVDLLARTIDKNSSFTSKLGRDIGDFIDPWSNTDGVTAANNMDLLASGLKKLGNASPEAAANFVQSLRDILQASKEGNAEALKTVDDYGLSKDAIDKLAKSLPAASDAYSQMVETAKKQKQSEQDAAAALKEHDDAIAANIKVQQELNKIREDGVKRNDDYRKSIDDVRQAQIDSVSHVEDLARASRDVESAYYDLQAKGQDLIKTEKDKKASADDIAQAERDVADAQGKVVDKILAQAAAYAASRGDIHNSTQDINDQVAILKNQQKVYPELRNEIQLYIDKLKIVPPSVDTTVMLHLNAHLDNIIVDGETHAAGSTTISVLNATKRSATGTPSFAGGWTTLNEQGNEAVFLPKGSSVLGASQTANRQAAGPTQPITQIFNLPPGLNPVLVADATNNYRRRGGR